MDAWCPRQESNLRTWLRRPMLYPLSYEGGAFSLPLLRERSTLVQCAASRLDDEKTQVDVQIDGVTLSQ